MFVFVFKEGTREFMVPCKEADIYDSKPISFSQSAESRDTRYAMLGERYKEGEKIYGWFVRIVKDGRVVAAAGSNERFKKFAESGLDVSTRKP
ncbi:MAG: hypothetical protein WCH98_06020 [Verrucomicrobiota bacterium]